MIITQGTEEKELTITFSYPYGNGFDPAWVQSVIWLLLHELSKSKEERILGSILKAGSCYVDHNRDAIAIDFNNNSKDDWLLMVDTDVEFAPNTLELLVNHIINNPEARIIACRVNLLNGLPVFYKREGTKMVHQCFPWDDLKELDYIGTGMIAIHREVFPKLKESEGHIHFFHKIITSEGIGMGDDFSFCMRAARAGFKLYGAWDIFGQHWKPQPCPQRYLEANQLTVKDK